MMSVVDIRKLKGITSFEAEKLQLAGIKTIEELWLRIAMERDGELRPLTDQTGISEDRLIELLADESLRDTRPFVSWWLREHWLDLMLLLALVALVVRILYLVR